MDSGGNKSMLSGDKGRKMAQSGGSVVFFSLSAG